VLQTSRTRSRRVRKEPQEASRAHLWTCGIGRGVCKAIALCAQSLAEDDPRKGNRRSVAVKDTWPESDSTSLRTYVHRPRMSTIPQRPQPGTQRL
jgi:hypothetical protein